MSVIPSKRGKSDGAEARAESARASPVEPQRFHRLATVRQLEGVSRRTLARRMKVSIKQIRWEENEFNDVPVSTLYRWQKALGVPLQELLVQPAEELSQPIKLRAQLLRLMKTAVTIRERSRQASIQRLAQMLMDQLVEIMPELQGVAPWPVVGKSRMPSDCGQAYYRQISEHLFDQQEEEVE
ncbi:MAG: helix-turn-helix domain-containing protein [Thermoguttaceae bacterium]|nr:helix-turn-helix domain-containing protein [Thermoguttaceae bacterium]MDW8078731.1 helix-turn-helix transcriptional regulator [Thermoguttaceae bacterium]